MTSAKQMPETRSQFISELRDMESALLGELHKVRKEITRLSPAKPQRQQRDSSAANNKTVSILAGKNCPKCGKKGHDLRWHRWNDGEKKGHDGSKNAA